MPLRHEWKHEISASDLPAIRSRLEAVMQHDSHAVNGTYKIRSLYFDDLFDTALREKLDGVNARKKFRLRYYNDNLSLILLEKKSKRNGLCAKEQLSLSVEEAQAVSDGAYMCISDSDQPLLKELYHKMQTKGLRPKTIVDYTREPFVHVLGNVRVTLDYHIRTSLSCTAFLNPDCITIPAGNAPIILEVKWDEFLPSIVRDIVQLKGRHTSAFSKYAACRMYD